MLLLVELYSFHKWFNRNRVPREESTVGICHLHLRSTTNSDRCQRMLLLVELYSWRAINTMKTLLANRVPREESTVGICSLLFLLYGLYHDSISKEQTIEKEEECVLAERCCSWLCSDSRGYRSANRR